MPKITNAASLRHGGSAPGIQLATEKERSGTICPDHRKLRHEAFPPSIRDTFPALRKF